MNKSNSIVLILSIAAGSVTSFAIADEPLGVLEPSRGKVLTAGHIYFNIATGEKIVSLASDDQTSRNNNPSSGPIWSVTNTTPCASAGYTSGYFFPVDDNSPTIHTSLATAITLLDYGDIQLDSVVDCVHINWVSAHNDVDSDNDGIGDGVEGLGGQWTYWDADNGRQLQACMRTPLISFTFVDLPGNIMGEDQQTRYSADIDLVGSFSSSLTFELGDSDGDLQGASFGSNDVDTDGDGIGDGVSIANADQDFDSLPDSDLDGDGLFDWAWTVRFFQPGTEDFDDDGVLDGDIADSMKPIGVSFAVPDGEAIDNGDGTWTWEIDSSTQDAGNGEEDRFVIFSPPDSNGDIIYAGGFWFGGFACEGELEYTPPAMFEHQLFGPGHVGVDCGDYNGDGSVNFFDVSAFLQLFATEDHSADINNDGRFNFFDVSVFLSILAAGCP